MKVEKIGIKDRFGEVGKMPYLKEILKGLENFSYGFSAKTSIYGLTVGADTEHLNIPATDEKT